MTTNACAPIREALNEALGGAPRATLAEMLDDRSVLHVAGASGLAGDYQGREAILGLLQRMDLACAGSLRFVPDRTTVGPSGRLRVRGRIHGRRGGQAQVASVALEATVGGSVVREAWIDCPDQRAWDAFWSG